MVKSNNHQHIHCIGIGGIGLSAIADIFLNRGYRVSGSDLKESETTKRLQQKGATIFFSHEAENISDSDIVIYSAAVSPENPELKMAREKGLKTLSRAEVLGYLMEEYKNSIAVSGTHGKTTTTSMISLILENSLLDPTILVGGNLSEIGGNVKIGNSEYFITEACEYMDSFLNLRPHMEIILNIDSDHLDYFKDIDHIVHSFDRFAKLVPKDGTIIAYAANAFVNSILNQLECKIITFGFDARCDYYASNIKFNHSGMPGFDVYRGKKKLCSLQLNIPGEHNIANSLASIACCHSLGLSIDTIVSTLESFTGTQRRFDVIGMTSTNIKVIDDYAHHPTEIKATLKAAQNVPHNKVWCIFQPHTYTRTLALFDDFAYAFEDADKVILTDIYAAREKNIHKVSSKDLVYAIKSKDTNKEVLFISDFHDIADFIAKNAQPYDLVITMGAGDIYKVAEIILENDNREGLEIRD